MTPADPQRCLQCGLTREEANHPKSCLDRESFAPVVPRFRFDNRIELHWVGWGGPIERLPPLCDLTVSQARRLSSDIEALLQTVVAGEDVDD